MRCAECGLFLSRLPGERCQLMGNCAPSPARSRRPLSSVLRRGLVVLSVGCGGGVDGKLTPPPTSPDQPGGGGSGDHPADDSTMTDDEPRAVHRSAYVIPRGSRAVRSKWVLTGILLCVAVALPGSEAGGYRFFRAFDDDPYPPSAGGAMRWHPRIWAPGEMLTWVVADDPGWTSSWVDSSGETREPPFGNPADVVPFFRTALEAWSGLGTADIRWEVSGVDPSVDHVEFDDDRPTFFVDPDANAGSYARRTVKRWRGGWVISDCDVPLSPWAAAAVDENPWWPQVLIHEVGHCLGLAHAGAYPRNNDHRQDLGSFGIDPLMSYGPFTTGHLAPDDRVGASLLRPSPSWAISTGAIAGSVTSAESPAPFVQVFASRVSGGVATDAVGSFTNGEGAFIIEGLEPGQYLLWAGPLNRLGAHGQLFRQQLSPELDVAEQALLLPVTVSRGEVTRGVEISLGTPRGGPMAGRTR